MTRRRFIADLVTGNRAVLLGAHAAHLSRVLRVRPGQQFDIAADGRICLGTVVGIADERVEFELGEEHPPDTILPVSVYLAIVRFERMEWAIEKCVELGADRLIPVIAARTETHLADAATKRADRWRRIIQQAAEQSRRALVPQLETPVRLSREMPQELGTRIVLAETEHSFSLKDALQQPADDAVTPPSPDVALAIGPEGGWTDAELNRFTACGWIRASLGHNILRTETAALAALAITLSLIGEG